MKLTQGTFSFLPDLTDAQITAQARYCIDNGWALSLEHTDDPHPRNTFWELWALPMFDLASPISLMEALSACRAAHPGNYVRISAFDSTKGWESLRLSFIAQRPGDEPGFFMNRVSGPSRSIRYSTTPYSTNHPPGRRYQ
jgi:ribulose-bisphosphate carboxylase small chain